MYSSSATAFTGTQPETVKAGVNVSGISDANAGATTAIASVATTKTAANSDWVATTIALKPLQGATSLTIGRPTPLAANDYVLVR